MPPIPPTPVDLPGRRLRGPIARSATPTPAANQLIVKIRSTLPAVRRFAAAAEGNGEPSILERLHADGVLARVQPIFPRRNVIPSVNASLAAAVADAHEEKRSRHALVSLTVDRTVSPEAIAHYLEAQEDVEYAFVPAPKHYLASSTRPDPLLSRQWAYAAIRLHSARGRKDFVDAEEIVVAVVDSGVDEGHPDLAASIDSYVNYIAAEDKRDTTGHGTHVAGIIAAQIDNGLGIAGVCQTKLMIIKGLPHPDGSFVMDEYYRALAHPIDHGAHVINLSLGGPYDPAERDIIEDALAENILVVAAMGNSYQRGNPVEYPAAYGGVIAVGASDAADRRASFSNTGAHIDVVAPGADILSTVPRYPSHFSDEVMYDSWDGTSMATPHVAAAAALYRAKHGAATSVADVLRDIRGTAHPIQGQTGHDERYGTGRLDVDRLLA